MSDQPPLIPADDTPPATAPRRRGRPPGSKTKTEPVKPATNPAKAAAVTRDRAPRKAGKPSTKEALQESIAAQLVAVGIGVSGVGLMVGNQTVGRDGVIVVEHAEDLASALAELAQTNDSIKRALEAGVAGTGWLGVITAAGTMTWAIVQNHAQAGEPVEPPAPSAFDTLANMSGQIPTT